MIQDEEKEPSELKAEAAEDEGKSVAMVVVDRRVGDEAIMRGGTTCAREGVVYCITFVTFRRLRLPFDNSPGNISRLS